MGRFRIKITPWWASNEYVHFKYSTNGFIWHKIYSREYDILSNKYYMKPLIAGYDNAERIISKFNTLDDVRNYEQEEEQKMISHNNNVDAKRKWHEAKRKAVYKKFG